VSQKQNKTKTKNDVFSINMHQQLHYGRENRLILIIHDIRLSTTAREEHMRNCQMSTITRHTFTYHLEEINGTPRCILRNDMLLQIELSG